jgi:hypothetical protein
LESNLFFFSAFIRHLDLNLESKKKKERNEK